MISLREFEAVFSMLAPWESDAEAFVRTDADGIVYVPNSMFADTEEIDAAYDAMKEGSWIAFPDASELRLGHRMALRFAREFLSEEQCERVVAIFSRRGASDDSKISSMNAESFKTGTPTKNSAYWRHLNSGSRTTTSIIWMIGRFPKKRRG